MKKAFSNRIFSHFTSLISSKVTELLNFPKKIDREVDPIGKSGETGRFSVTSNFLATEIKGNQMTRVTVTLHNQTAIRLDFSFNKDVNAKIKTIDGWAFVKDGKFWTVPVKQLDTLVRTFGAALSIDAAVLDAKMENDLARVRTFVTNLHAAGISLDVLDGKVIGSGGAYCLDPWQREIDARADKIAALGLQHSQVPARVRAPACEGTDPETLRQAEILVTGMHNAERNQYAQEAMKAKRKGWKR